MRMAEGAGLWNVHFALLPRRHTSGDGSRWQGGAVARGAGCVASLLQEPAIFTIAAAGPAIEIDFFAVPLLLNVGRGCGEPEFSRSPLRSVG